MDDWRKDLSKSSRQFLDYVWPAIRHKCGGGSIKPVEVMLDNDVARDLDVLCGIDVWHSIDGSGARGIASRVQETNKNWRTFTVRRRRFSGARTEYDKRKEAINSGGRFIFPYLTCQAYIGDEGLIGLGLAKTTDLYAAIQEAIDAGAIGDRGGGVWINRTGNAEFYCVRFDAVRGCWTYDALAQKAA